MRASHRPGDSFQWVNLPDWLKDYERAVAARLIADRVVREGDLAELETFLRRLELGETPET